MQACGESSIAASTGKRFGRMMLLLNLLAKAWDRTRESVCEAKSHVWRGLASQLYMRCYPIGKCFRMGNLRSHTPSAERDDSAVDPGTLVGSFSCQWGLFPSFKARFAAEILCCPMNPG